MYLLEHDAKEVLARHGIPVPPGCLIASATELSGAALPAGPWVVKGQVAAGGRGRSGLIRKAASLDEVAAHVEAVLGRSVKGHRVSAVRIEQDAGPAQEAYLGLLLDAAAGAVRVIVSARGGMDIESLPRATLASETAPPEPVALLECVRRLAESVGNAAGRVLMEAGERIARVFLEREALLVEINPLFVRGDGSWIAGDAKIVTDDNALSRQPALRALLERRAAAYPEAALKLRHGFDYVVVDPDGEIGLLTTGAGLSMMLIDELRAAGLRPYNFLDIRTGGLRGEITRLVTVLDWIAAGGRVRALLVNIFAGITDLGEFSRLLVAALRASPRFTAPVVARLVGNGLPAAREVLSRAGIPLHTDLDDAVAEVRRRLSA
jgi:succinyl-CoA synthetase beta subunit